MNDSRWDDRLRVLDIRSNGTRADPEEFDAVRRRDRRYRYELIRGLIIVLPSARPGEARINDLLGHLIHSYQEASQEGRTSLDLTLPEAEVRTDNRRRVDRAIWVGLGRRPDPAADFPAIVIEIVRRPRLDDQARREEYLAAGAREHWLLDRSTRALIVGAPGVTTTQDDKQVYQSPLLPGLELSLARLFDEGAAIDPLRRPKADQPQESPR